MMKIQRDIQTISTQYETKFIVDTRNFISVGFYVILCALVYWFNIEMEYSLDIMLTYEGRMLTLSLIWFLASLRILKASFQRTVVTISAGKITLFNGIANIGRLRTIPLESVENIFVREYKSYGEVEGDSVSVNTSDSFIIIRASKDIKILRNKTTTATIKKLCDLMKIELEKFRMN